MAGTHQLAALQLAIMQEEKKDEKKGTFYFSEEEKKEEKKGTFYFSGRRKRRRKRGHSTFLI